MQGACLSATAENDDNLGEGKIKAIHRDKLSIIFDLITTIKNYDACNIGRICRDANISHYSAGEKLDALAVSGLVKIEKTPNPESKGNSKRVVRMYSMTDKGNQFYLNLQKVYEVINESCLVLK